MAIDFTGDSGFESVGVSLAYLVYGVYHDENGTERAVYWCGPKNRVGSGLIAPVPPNPEHRGGGLEVIWESSLTRSSLESDLVPLHQYIQTVTDLNFNVDISGPPTSPLPSQESCSETLFMVAGKTSGCMPGCTIWGRVIRR